MTFKPLPTKEHPSIIALDSKEHIEKEFSRILAKANFDPKSKGVYIWTKLGASKTYGTGICYGCGKTTVTFLQLEIKYNRYTPMDREIPICNKNCKLLFLFKLGLV